jgi:hypothetical protein
MDYIEKYQNQLLEQIQVLCRDTPNTPARIATRRVAGAAITPASLFLDQRAIKNRPGIKSCVIRRPEAPAIITLFFNRQVNE